MNKTLMENVTKLGKGGRIVIPAAMRKLIGVSEGDELILRYRDGRLEVMTVRQAVQEAQNLVSRFVPKGRQLVDELLAERRAEAERE
jgi:AbrB family looped-hinge helix DNA binding protein